MVYRDCFSRGPMRPENKSRTTKGVNDLADGIGGSVDAVTGRRSVHIENRNLDGLDDYASTGESKNH
jgi:hypothetical protein